MNELHENEQYFFTKEFEDWYVNTLVNFFPDKKICCVCCPRIGVRLVEAGLDVKILDIDTRFNTYTQFVYYDVKDPQYLEDEFDVIVCDPPFFNVSFTELLHAIKTLTHFTMYKTVFMTYLKRREEKFLTKFQDFDLYRVKNRPQYQTVDVTDPKNDIRLYCNYLFPMQDVEPCDED